MDELPQFNTKIFIIAIFISLIGLFEPISPISLISPIWQMGLIGPMIISRYFAAIAWLAVMATIL